MLPVGYVLTATPQMWLGIILAWLFASSLAILPVSGAYSLALQPEWSLEFAGSFLYHWILPFSALFLVAFGGWAIGMRNMIIYELEADYSNYLAALGAPTKLVRKYAYRNALLPQITGLALALGAVVAGAIVVEIVFSYPGLGTLTLTAIQNRDYFLIQGIFLFLIVGVLIANLIIDIAYVVIDPRTRVGMQGGADVGLERGACEIARARAGSRRGVRAAPRGRHAARAARRSPAFRVRLLRASELEVRPGARRRPRFCSRSRSSARCSRITRRSSSPARWTSLRHREYWFGTTSFGQDVFAQFVYGLRAAFLVGVLGGGIAWLLGAGVGFTAGYRGGWVDDVLNMLTNVVLVIPTLAILIIVAAYLNVHSYAIEAILIGLTSWPWAARAVRAQTFSLKTREFVDIARLSGRSTRQIIATRDRAEHELVPVHDVHPAVRRRDPHRRLARLPRPRARRRRSRSG